MWRREEKHQEYYRGRTNIGVNSNFLSAITRLSLDSEISNWVSLHPQVSIYWMAYWAIFNVPINSIDQQCMMTEIVRYYDSTGLKISFSRCCHSGRRVYSFSNISCFEKILETFLMDCQFRCAIISIFHNDLSLDRTILSQRDQIKKKGWTLTALALTGPYLPDTVVGDAWNYRGCSRPTNRLCHSPISLLVSVMDKIHTTSTVHDRILYIIWTNCDARESREGER